MKKMEYIASEFPDICQWFGNSPRGQTNTTSEPQPTNMPDRTAEALNSQRQSNPGVTAVQIDLAEQTVHTSALHQPHVKTEEFIVIEDSSFTRKSPEADVVPGVYQTGVDEGMTMCKAGLGCTWSGSEETCTAGETCAFVRKMLCLDELCPSITYTSKPRVQRVMLARPTANGLVQITGTRDLSADQIKMIMEMSRQNQIKIIQVCFVCILYKGTAT